MSNTYSDAIDRLIAAVERLCDIETEATKINERMVALQELLIEKSIEAMGRQKAHVPTDDELDDAVLGLIRNATENDKAHPKEVEGLPITKRGGMLPEDISSAMCKLWDFPGTDTRVAASLQHLKRCGEIKFEMVHLYDNYFRHKWFYIEGGNELKEEKGD